MTSPSGKGGSLIWPRQGTKTQEVRVFPLGNINKLRFGRTFDGR